MAFLAVVVILGFFLDHTKTCKPVNYEFKQFNVPQHGYGCKKGCFGYANTTECLLLDGSVRPGCFDEQGRIAEGDHYKQDTCVECKTINANFVVSRYIEDNPYYAVGAIVTINNTELEKACNNRQAELQVVDLSGTISRGYVYSLTSRTTCIWNYKKSECVASSCPNLVARAKCNGNWTEGKCKKSESSDYRVTYFSPYDDFPGNFESDFYLSDLEKTSSGCVSQFSNYTSNRVDSYPGSANYRWVTCDDLVNYYHTQRKLNQDAECIKFTSDHVTECKYRREHPNKEAYSESYEYSKSSRKYCHQIYGCLYATHEYGCSTWSVWAFVLTLIILILVVVGAVVVFVIVAHVVLKLF